MTGHRVLEKKQITQGNNRKVQNPGGSPRSWTKPDKEKTTPTISRYCRSFFFVYVRDQRHQKVTKRHTSMTNS